MSNLCKQGHSPTEPPYKHCNHETNIDMLMPPNLQLHSNFADCPIDILHRKRLQSRIMVLFTCDTSQISFYLGRCFPLDFHALDIFKDYRPVFLSNAPQVEFVWYFLMIRLRFYILARILHCILSGGIWFWLVPLWVMWTLMLWLRLCLPNISMIKLLFFSCS